MHLRSRIVPVFAALSLVAGAFVVGAGTAVAGASQSGATSQVLMVFNHNANSASAHDQGNGGGCGNAPYSTISAAVAAAHPGDTVEVCPGTYTEDVIVAKSLTLIGQNATIDAAGQNNGVQVVSSNVTVEGFTITNAIGEGILVGVDNADDPNLSTVIDNGVVLSHVAILDNDVKNNDQGFAGPGGSASTCNYLPLPSDCGGGIHFNAVSNSTISGNVVSGNSDGVLLTDDYGPNFDNVVSDNDVVDNATECGITLPSHNSGAVSVDPKTGVVTTHPTQGGVYDNQILDNTSSDNGTVPISEGPGVVSGSGAGVGIFAPFPGAAAYDNVVEGNTLDGNGLAGVTIHAHAPGQDVSGNQILDNTIGTNNIDGDPENGPPFPEDLSTTGISIFSALSPVAITVEGNSISSDSYGIWYTSATVTASGLSSNSFKKVTTPIEAA